MLRRNEKWFGKILVIVLCLFVVDTTQADWQGEDKLLAADDAWDRFGESVSIDGDYAIVGARCDDDNGNDSGSAYIFKRDGTTWIEQAKLTASDGTAGDFFGCSVSISRNYAIVGAHYDDDSGDMSGSAYMFYFDGANWAEQAKLTASDGTAYAEFGWSVLISGDYVIVGAINGQVEGESCGSAYIFKRDGEGWLEQARLLASDRVAADSFGCSVSISGTYAIVGAYRDNTNTGSAYIFEMPASGWVNSNETAKLTASDGATFHYFGKSVSISGDYAIVGATNDDDNGDDSGSAYIFTPNDVDPNNWDQQDKLLASDGDIWHYFGEFVSIDGDYAIVGAWQSDGNESNSGSAYIFKRDGTSWTEKAKLTASDGTWGDKFGGSVSIDGDYAIVGANGDDDGTGSAYMFKRVSADLSSDGFVNWKDFAIFARQWLQSN